MFEWKAFGLSLLFVNSDCSTLDDGGEKLLTKNQLFGVCLSLVDRKARRTGVMRFLISFDFFATATHPLAFGVGAFHSTQIR